MAIVKMKKVTMVALQSEKEEIVKALQKFGGVQLISLEDRIQEGELEGLKPDGDNENVGRLEARLSQVKYCIDFLNRYKTSKKPMFAPKLQIEEAQYPKYLDDEETIGSVYESCKAIDSKFTELKSIETKDRNLIQQLTPWVGLDSPLSLIKNTRHVHLSMGFVPLKSIEEFKGSLLADGIEAQLEEIGRDKENEYMLLLYHRDCEEQVSQILKQYGWTRSEFNDLSGTPKENIEKISNEISELENTRQKLTEQAGALVGHMEYLEVLYDLLVMERDKSGAVKYFGKTEKTFMLHGWVPERLGEKLEQLIGKITDRYTLLLEDPAEEEAFPVLLDNPALVKPVEMITEQYSLPSPRSVDPNLIMAPFFFAFFGMMVSDAGYGIVLAAITAFILFKYRPEGGQKKFFGLLCLGGVSTFVWGALFGGWFGGLLKIKPIWFDPLTNPLFMLIFCVILGIVQLYIGMGIQAYKSIRAGNVKDAIYDQGFWVLLLTGLMFLALPQVAAAGKYMAIIGAAGMILTQGRSQKNIFKRLMSGVLSLYNVTGFLGDALSYSRLFALGLATGVIGSVFNSIAFMLWGSLIGKPFAIVLLLFGHTFNIALNVLGAYVHSSRLQYVEFFGKFYEGEGVAFNPFRISTRFIKQNQ